ncbi:MAG: iron-sulfur cluster insertion protein ErpA [Zetaproteobacteria bacterium CG_4_9_14_3_um_filter_49_83]|nr:MAG: iron-sulfur cluster insertion protein ErpA [Zetaproteobacteria bacterium CG1_02_49_23]PIQ33774.1 MAG: iron-sulfur cluster insertion protein ErpA [Zetaproteobacteria bacterium CG17_big_fil_post_rev_8_21_14_2_50_50_13]PIV29988.1 MAG: iron-sulfur cluster insertion protein ErpA [Zetaproteobacteria bacterium CG02_land_8_20_14_3_00_50_9]PIY55092.1 MAG: iron-sulfur cluster insertion protein ErpA [Zetaproteobacteria bacterium CG_4_10_14_0_8_um_filter_49_80]PJA36558.1 MAG: iron-sulfur cluster in
MSDTVRLTESAAKKINGLLAQDDNSNMHLRIFVSGGGCSGFQYGFTFDDEIKDNDTVIESLGVKLLVDQMSLDLLKGSEVDYQTSLQGESFVIRNPNAGSTCGCGKSFTPAEQGQQGCGHASAAY